MGVKLGILGLGTVGTGTVQLLQDVVGRNLLLQSVEIYRVGVRSLAKIRDVELPADVLTTDLESIVNDPAVDIVVELIGGLEPARSLILQALNNGKHVVTANKAAIARFGAEIFTTANQAGVYVMLEAAVGGGIPVIQPLKQSLSVNRIHTITGIVNGTTNYILTRMQTEGSNFSDVLADAQKLGYAEADPTADVDGLDAADKIAILASLGFDGRINLEEVYCEGIRQVSKTDITYAEKLGFVIKLLAIAQQYSPSSPLSVRVHPTLVAKAHPLASINGVYNAILVEGEPIGQVMFFGPGAGAGATASAVTSDILNLVAVLKTSTTNPNPLLTCGHQDYCQIAPITELVTRFYARFLTKDQPGVIGKLGTCFGNYGVSLESVVQTGFQGGLAEIVVVTHDVREGDFRQALAEIQNLEAIDSIPSLLRVL
ncbi:MULTISPECIES: homoserine dehydrogenase [Cyanophyceae]|uniref:homoserine dehydrogenase n=1 Tax=Cyanophyceae TaxID=3028117 RepID=UPI00232BFBD6|nr:MULTISPECIES: homoserine dehydrogenase [Cyanophyceae]MDB9357633.1 homoserine dehydrogenase [Nodularia spumigena CS-587/03]MDB9303607.1 homoserine dehydrogenase [Nodularia spumigena CS-591/12]MDB9317901.1 homoserine dehydrogenase [Nodularia spumigena CS-590/01A]MDB9324104.1 homoserine dehydrogenase [Nodularia spumigena CS-591/07A]MDB9324614.1 homoserine dehydrogenase [Nodularia spumigena CS-590/02]